MPNSRMRALTYPTRLPVAPLIFGKTEPHSATDLLKNSINDFKSTSTDGSVSTDSPSLEGVILFFISLFLIFLCCCPLLAPCLPFACPSLAVSVPFACPSSSSRHWYLSYLQIVIIVHLLADCLPISPVLCSLLRHVLMFFTERCVSAARFASEVTN